MVVELTSSVRSVDVINFEYIMTKVYEERVVLEVKYQALWYQWIPYGDYRCSLVRFPHTLYAVPTVPRKSARVPHILCRSFNLHNRSKRLYFASFQDQNGCRSFLFSNAFTYENTDVENPSTIPENTSI